MLASDSEDEKRIRKAQERALKEKKQNVSRKQEDRDRNSSLGASRSCATNDDRMLFRVIVLALSLYFTGKCLHSACLYLVVVCFMRQHTGDGKLFSFVRTQ